MGGGDGQTMVVLCLGSVKAAASFPPVSKQVCRANAGFNHC